MSSATAAAWVTAIATALTALFIILTSNGKRDPFGAIWQKMTKPSPSDDTPPAIAHHLRELRLELAEERRLRAADKAEYTSMNEVLTQRLSTFETSAAERQERDTVHRRARWGRMMEDLRNFADIV